MAKLRTREGVQGAEQASSDPPEEAVGAVAAARHPRYGLRSAQWRAFQQLASTLPSRRVLSVELTRTTSDETAAIFTVVSDGEPVRYVVTRDAHGSVTAHVDAPAATAAASTPLGIPGIPGAIVAVAAEMLAAAFDLAGADELVA